MSRISWECEICGHRIADGEGHLYFDYSGDIVSDRESLAEQVRADREAWAKRARSASEDEVVLSLNDLVSPCRTSPRLRLTVCHASCDPRPDENPYACWFDVERVRTWEQVAEWVSHLSDKEWFGTADVKTLLLRAQAAPRSASPDAKGVYCVRSGEFVKIGKTIVGVGRRLRGLQTGNPEAVELLGMLSDNPAHEAKFHQRFAEYRSHGEWFKIDGDLKEFLVRQRLIQ